jgi:hypothetical protein
MITGIYSTAPSLISWIPNNTAAHNRRVATVAMGFISPNVGGIISTWIYPQVCCTWIQSRWQVQPFTGVHHIGSSWGGDFFAPVEESAEEQVSGSNAPMR